MKKMGSVKVWIIILMLICTIGLAKNEISVSYSETVLRVKTRLADFTFDAEKGFLKDIVFLMTDQPTHVFSHGDDGFDLFSEGERILPEEIYINGQPIDVFMEMPGIQTPNSTSPDTRVIEGQDMVLTFHYPTFQKRIIIPYGPYYEIDVDISGQIPENTRLSLPRVGFQAQDKIDDSRSVFMSYFERTNALAIFRILTSGTQFSTRDPADANQIVIPQSGIVVRGYIGPVKLTLIQHVFADDYVWLSREINAYPGASSWYSPIFYMFVYLLDWLESVTGNYGWAIILFTIIVYIALYPLIHAQNKSMIKQRMLQMDEEFKKIQLIKDPKEKQMKLMKLYKDKKVNPGGGCLMMLIPIPIFFLLFAVIRYESELFAFSPRFLFWEDLSIGGFTQNFGIVLVSVFISLFNSLITAPEIRVAKQGLLFAFFPFLFITLSTGLQLYWVTSSVIRLVSTYFVYRRHNLKGISIREFFGSFKRTQ